LYPVAHQNKILAELMAMRGNVVVLTAVAASLGASVSATLYFKTPASYRNAHLTARSAVLLLVYLQYVLEQGPQQK
jgi:hypothetical protein